MKASYNVVIAGKTGVGKSSLINYLYGENVMKTGVGKPVTQRGFEPVECQINEMPVKLFDSWGLEVGKDEEWLKMLEEELKRRDTGKPVQDWFHSVFYCIGASGLRIEDFDIKIIDKFSKANYKVVIALTKADTISEDAEREFIEIIKKELSMPASIIPVCSEEKELRGGGKSEKFGKADIEAQVYKDFWDSIILRLPERCEGILKSLLEKWRKGIEEYIDEKIGRFNEKEVQKGIERSFEWFFENEIKKLNTVKAEIQNTLSVYGSFARNLNYPPPGVDIEIIFPSNPETEREWWEYTLMTISIVALPVTLPYYLIFEAKSDNKRDMYDYVERLVSISLKETFPELKNRIEDGLKKIKQNVE